MSPRRPHPAGRVRVKLHVTSSEAPRDCSERLYALVNGVTGGVDGDISLDSLPAVNALLELDEMSIAEFGEALKAGDLDEVVVIRPEEELNSSSVVDEAVLEDTKKALSAKSGSAIFKDPSDPFYPVLQEYTDVVSENPPMGLPLIEACIMRLTWFREPNTVSLDSGPYQRNSVTSLTRSSVRSTRQG
ncbi:hypothetical protein PC128_g19959 [Phytophthora cactorum]|nr:hypothetical protein PC128_g19959 [Phytophthora cactorum]